MPFLLNHLAFIRMRRVFEFLTLIFFVIIVLTIGSKWSSPTVNDNNQQLKINVNPFLPNEQTVNNDNNNRMIIEKPINGRPDLAKYIHLDLKGAPPQPMKFYENFLNFIDKLQMGVKGLLIEYEDMLPLQGRFLNVSDKQAV